MKKHLLFLGAPGAGKGTQAELLSNAACVPFPAPGGPKNNTYFFINYLLTPHTFEK